MGRSMPGGALLLGTGGGQCIIFIGGGGSDARTEGGGRIHYRAFGVASTFRIAKLE